MVEEPADVLSATGVPGAAAPARLSAPEERALIERFEAADIDELARLVARPTRHEEEALVSYLGAASYERLHERALRRNLRRASRTPVGNVVVLHGILGAELNATDAAGASMPIWMRPLRLLAGALRHLELDPAGEREADPAWTVAASAILNKHYGDLLLGLSERWRVAAFFYDWRKDLRHAAAALDRFIARRFASGEQVHLVAHSMGGLVARSFMLEHPGRWRSLDGRLVMLGTPNHGSYDIVRTLVGRERLTRLLALADFQLSLDDLLRVLNSFPGSYQLLPSPDRDPAAAPLYEPDAYAPVAVSERHLRTAREQHERLAAAVDPERMLYVAGSGEPTFVGVDPRRLGDERAYRVSLAGDGRVPHALGTLDGVETWYAPTSHGGLTRDAGVLEALHELLERGTTETLAERPPAVRAAAGEPALRTQLEARDDADEEALRAAVRQLDAREQTSAGARGRAAPAAGGPARLSEGERTLDELVVRGWLAEPERTAAAPAPAPVRAPAIAFTLAHRDITKAHRPAGEPLVDALAVGHYVGVHPQFAEAALDRALSRALSGRFDAESGLLTELTLRGTISGALGQPFILPDPRAPAERVVALAGLGAPGRLGPGELVVAVRELCWALGRLGCRHLASVLIGAGTGSLSPASAVGCWVDGIAQALAGQRDGARLERVTLCELDAARLEPLDAALARSAERLRREGLLELRYEPAPARTRARWRRAADAPDSPRGAESPEPAEPPPTRVTVSREPRGFRFGAITQTAAVPEREVALDARLVTQANDELAAEVDEARRRERGRFLGRLLLPADLRDALGGGAPVVMLLDATSARVHWELVVRPGAEPSGAGGPRAGELRDYLGIGAGFTRQLRTTFAPPPEPPPPPERRLRVLVVADPAEDAHLPGAEEEGLRVAELFETAAHPGIEVVRLFGPRQATRTEVLRRLLLERFHVMHFAGHCFYDPADPSASGWIFSDGEVLSANELRRIDRVPEFVFSNACESGITPDRSGERSAALAPSFAESFFERGVGNFVCTAWPVDDGAARAFAGALYAGLLGLPEAPGGEGPLPIHRAMAEARRATAGDPAGARSWGAYQHYGDPLYRLVAPASG